MAKANTYYPAKQNTYFGTTVKVVAIGGIAYALWWLFHNASKLHWPHLGMHFAWPWESGKGQDGTGSDQDANKESTGNTDTKGYDPNASWDTVVIKKGETQDNQTYDYWPDGSLKSVTYGNGNVYNYPQGQVPMNGYRRRRGIGDAPTFPMSATDFINTYFAAAQRAQKMTGVFPETMFAQAILESSKNGKVGGSDLAKSCGNLFGIKADSSWTGKTYQGYRAYDSFQDSIADYYTFLQGNSRYNDALQAGTPQDQISEIAAAGYAENPNYADSLNSLLPMIMAAESQAPKDNGTYTPTQTDVSVNTDKEVEKASAGGDSGATGTDKFTMWIMDNKTTVKWIAGIGFVVLVTGIATDGFTKNPLKRLAKR